MGRSSDARQGSQLFLTSTAPSRCGFRTRVGTPPLTATILQDWEATERCAALKEGPFISVQVRIPQVRSDATFEPFENLIVRHSICLRPVKDLERFCFRNAPNHLLLRVNSLPLEYEHESAQVR